MQLKLRLDMSGAILVSLKVNGKDVFEETESVWSRPPLTSSRSSVAGQDGRVGEVEARGDFFKGRPIQDGRRGETESLWSISRWKPVHGVN